MSLIKRAVLFCIVIAGISGTSAEDSRNEDKPDQTESKKLPPKQIELITLLVTPPEGWYFKKHKIPGDNHEVLSMSETKEAALTGGFGIFRHHGFRTAPYTPEGIMSVDIQSISLGGLPFNTKEVKVGKEKRDGKWLGYTTEGKTTDLVFVKHENNVYRLSGTYPKDDQETRDLFWKMVAKIEFVEKSEK